MVKASCARCAKSEFNGGEGCENVECTPISLCFVPLEDDVSADDFARCEYEESRREAARERE